MKLRVLVLDGNDDFRRTLCAFLERVGMQVHGGGHAAVLDEALKSGPYDVAMCAVDLPGESGFSVAARLRLVSEAGLVLMTGEPRHEEKLLALSLGVDHYLAKPDDLREVEMIIRNLHRRLRMDPSETRFPHTPGVWTFDAARWILVAPGGSPLSLSMAEYITLHQLLLRGGEVVPRRELLSALDRRDVRIFSRNLDMIISRLRRKVTRLGEEKLPILSARGIGYVFTGTARIVGDVTNRTQHTGRP